MTEQTQPPKSRGRPPKGMTKAEMQTSRVAIEQPREDKNDPPRPRRVAMQARKKLEFIQQDPNYYYRWIQNRDGKLQMAKEAWYGPVKDDKGQEIFRQSGPYPLHLMRLPMKYRLEDEAEKQERVIETIKHESKLKQDEYIPDGRSHVVQKDGDFDPLL